MAGKASQSVDPLDDPVNVQPQVWPECPTCGAAYILRRGLSISRGWLWAWYRDCKHKSPPKVHDAREALHMNPECERGLGATGDAAQESPCGNRP